MKKLITICARDGSKGLPGKNIRLLHGKPLITWTLEQAVEYKTYRPSGYEPSWDEPEELRDIVVSTDSEQIADIARQAIVKFGNFIDSNGISNVIIRPKELAQDNTPKMDVIRHTHKMMTQKDKHYDMIVDLDVTNPMRTVQDINKCCDLLLENDANAVVSVTKARKSPYFNQLEDHYGFARLVKPGLTTRRQDAPQTWDMNASILVLAPEFLEMDDVHSPCHTNRLTVYEMPGWTFCDVDTPLDWLIAEFLKDKYGM